MAKWKEITSIQFSHTCSTASTSCNCPLGSNRVQLSYTIKGEVPVSIDEADPNEALRRLNDNGWNIISPTPTSDPTGSSKIGEFESINLDFWAPMMCLCEPSRDCNAATYRITVNYTRGKNTPDPTINAYESGTIPCTDLMVPPTTPMTPTVTDNGSHATIRFDVTTPCPGVCSSSCTMTFTVEYDYRVVSDCFITTAVYGTGLHPEITMLQGLRDNLIRRTRWGNKFFLKYFDAYEKISPEIAEKIKENPDAKEAILWGVIRPWTNYIKLSLRRPSAWNLEGVNPEMKKYLEEMKSEMDSWMNTIEFPTEFSGMSNEAIVDELNVLLMVLKEKGDGYLNDLVDKKVLPIAIVSGEYHNFMIRLKTSGRSQEQIDKILKLQK